MLMIQRLLKPFIYQLQDIIFKKVDESISKHITSIIDTDNAAKIIDLRIFNTQLENMDGYIELLNKELLIAQKVVDAAKTEAETTEATEVVKKINDIKSNAETVRELYTDAKNKLLNELTNVEETTKAAEDAETAKIEYLKSLELLQNPEQKLNNLGKLGKSFTSLRDKLTKNQITKIKDLLQSEFNKIASKSQSEQIVKIKGLIQSSLVKKGQPQPDSSLFEEIFLCLFNDVLKEFENTIDDKIVTTFLENKESALKEIKNIITSRSVQSNGGSSIKDASLPGISQPTVSQPSVSLQGGSGINIDITQDNIQKIINAITPNKSVFSSTKMTDMISIMSDLLSSPEVAAKQNAFIAKITELLEKAILKNLGHLINKNDIDKLILEQINIDVKKWKGGKQNKSGKKIKGGIGLDSLLPPGLGEFKPIIQCVIEHVLERIIKPIDANITAIFESPDVKKEVLLIIAGLREPPKSKSMFGFFGFGGDKKRTHKQNTHKKYTNRRKYNKSVKPYFR
jgi:predicted transcriptional regulator